MNTGIEPVVESAQKISDKVTAVGKSIQIKYLVALVLVASLSTTTFVMVSALIKTQESASAIINAAGKRRMTSQRVALFSGLLIAEKSPEQREMFRLKLKETIDALEKNHKGLIEGNKELNLPGKNSDTALQMYYGPETNLNARVEQYIATARNIQKAEASALTETNQDYAYVKQHGPSDLLKDLDSIVTIYQKESEAEIGLLRLLETVVFTLTLLLLTGEGIFIFRPLAKKIMEQMLAVEHSLLEVRKRTEAIETIYRNVKSGFLLINGKGEIQSGFTDSCSTLLSSELKPGTQFSDSLGFKARDAAMFGLLVGQVFDDILPEELSLSQIPQTVKMPFKTLRLDPSAIRNDRGEVSLVMFTINDITAQSLAEEKNQYYASILGILKQKEAFLNYLDEARKGFEHCRDALTAGNEKVVRFILHTLKGNAGLFQLHELSSFIHSVEDSQVLSLQDIASIEDNLRDFLNSNIEILSMSYEGKSERQFMIELNELAELESFALNAETIVAKRQDILEWISNIKLVKADVFLAPMLEAGRLLSQKLSKKIDFVLKSPEIRLDAELLAPVLQNLIHLIRNSVDHGIELPDERLEKSQVAKIEIECLCTATEWILSICDDGRGIDEEKVSRKAIALGLITAEQLEKMTRLQKQELIFHAGFSTAENVTLISGRGAGMGAVKEAAETLGGTLTLDSAKFRGTKFTITVPKKVQSEGRQSRAA